MAGVLTVSASSGLVPCRPCIYGPTVQSAPSMPILVGIQLDLCVPVVVLSSHALLCPVQRIRRSEPCLLYSFYFTLEISEQNGFFGDSIRKMS